MNARGIPRKHLYSDYARTFNFLISESILRCAETEIGIQSKKKKNLKSVLKFETHQQVISDSNI